MFVEFFITNFGLFANVSLLQIVIILKIESLTIYNLSRK